MRALWLEGTVEEIQQALQRFPQISGAQTAPVIVEANGDSAAAPGDTPEDKPAVTADMILKALNSKELHSNQRRLLDVLVGAFPDPIDKTSFEARLPEMNVASVIGGLGNRLAQIRGWPRRLDTGLRPSRHAIPVGVDARGRVVSYRASPELVEAWRRFNAKVAK